MLKSALSSHSPILLPVMEEFYSLQGEGINTGKPAYFLRIGGCEMGCFFCDVKESWDASKHSLTQVKDVVKRISDNPAKAVVITGGEPLLYNLDYLCAELHKQNISLFLETSGSEPLSGTWDWICVSPKKNHPPKPEIMQIASELKIVIFNDEDFGWAEQNAKLVSHETALLLQPEWSNIDKMLPIIIEYILNNPKWRISLQSHKYMNIQ